MIQYIRSKNFQTTCQHYAFEVSLNLYPVKEDAIYNTLYADSMLAEMSDEQIEKEILHHLYCLKMHIKRYIRDYSI